MSNATGNVFAANARQTDTPAISLRRYNETRRYIRDFYQERHPRHGIADGRPRPFQEK